MDIEQILQKLADDWPKTASIAEPVMRRIGDPIEAGSIEEALRPGGTRGLSASRSRTNAFGDASGRTSRRVGAVAVAAVIVAAVGTWFYFAGQPNSLSAQVIRAMDRAKSLDAVSYVREFGPHGEDRGLKKVGEARFVDGVGFRYDRGDEIRVGNGEAFWRFNRRTKTAFRSASGGIRQLVADWFDVHKFAQELQSHYECEPAADMSAGNERLKAFRLVPAPSYADPALRDGSLRMFIFLDPQSRVARIESRKKQGETWRTTWVDEWSYNVAIDPNIFRPEFGTGVKVIDSDRAFDELVDLKQAIYVADRGGLVYAVHRLERIEGGSLLVMSSVRGDEQVLAKFPLERRMIQAGVYQVTGPGTNYDASPQFPPASFRIPIVRATHQGIDVQWWVAVPRGQPPKYFDAGPHSVWIMAGMTPAPGSKFAESKGSVINHDIWRLELPAPELPALPSLSAIVESVYTDAASLSALLPFNVTLDLGVDEKTGQPVGKRAVPADATPAQFAEAVERHLLWWFRRDVEFQFTWASNPSSRGNETVALMYNPAVTDADLARLRSLPQLKRLYLSGTQITDADLATLSGLSQLRELALIDTAVTDAGLEHLKGLHALKQLSLRHTRVTEQGIKRLRSALPKLKTVSK
jgi:Leucine Rich Repeat (LRR) protein